ncbi:queuosine salvage protein [Scaptodrosophila lebanonensis]|uniref:Queuosine 5'-phosphate N-glycosylase/hydrolase n=1 Tax=Drosophila lebanonensis TaxID=7225 RepID=A0A6J2U3N6_DROLE|nr:queuosine salvage protein [Scaptodrosophila lebanonensis]
MRKLPEKRQKITQHMHRFVWTITQRSPFARLQTTISKSTIQMMTLSPRESGEHIVKNAKYVRVKPAGIERLTQEIVKAVVEKRLNVDNFSQHELHPKPTDPHAVEWIFVVDTLNFCFWTPTDYTKYKVNGYTGYFALCAAINRAMAEGMDITDAAVYSELDSATLKTVFRADEADTNIPLLLERVKCLHEVGKRLLDKWHGKFENVVKAANNSAVRLLQLIVDEFPCFRDQADYAGLRVNILKRAQILIGDLWACFRGEGLGSFHDIGEITMFADYRVPQVLVHFNCLEYTPDLMEVLSSDTIMQNGDAMEVEIRGASIYITEQVKDAVRKVLEKHHPEVSRANVNSILMDHFLWDYRRAHAKELEYIPFHKVLSIYY